MLSPVDIALIATVALVVFGSKRLPEVGRAVGQAVGNFKKALDGAEAAQPTEGEVRKADDDTVQK